MLDKDKKILIFHVGVKDFEKNVVPQYLSDIYKCLDFDNSVKCLLIPDYRNNDVKVEGV